MLREIARRLDEFIIERNVEAREEGLPMTPPCVIRVLGQTALLEPGVELTLAETDVLRRALRVLAGKHLQDSAET